MESSPATKLKRHPIANLDLAPRCRWLISGVLVAMKLFMATIACAEGRSEWVTGTPALVADIDTGRVLYAQNPTLRWHPASLAMLMTTYVTMTEIRAGRARTDDLLQVSTSAAREPYPKMGFPPGIYIRIDNALIIISVYRANDVASAIAEGVSGSIDNFVSLMNSHASRLGMRDTYFADVSHGSHDTRSFTTARDMAILARALYHEFPDQMVLFGLNSINYEGNIFENDNKLINRYSGSTGMKVGYSCSSGHNIVGTAERGERRLIAIWTLRTTEVFWSDRDDDGA